MRRLSFRWLSALILLSSLSLSACSSDDEETNNEPPISDACGNSILDGIETCDDGNTTGGDGAALRVRLKRAISATTLYHRPALISTSVKRGHVRTVAFASMNQAAINVIALAPTIRDQPVMTWSMMRQH